MQLLIILSILLSLCDTENLTVLLVGSRYKLTEQRVMERRKQILADCEILKV